MANHMWYTVTLKEIVLIFSMHEIIIKKTTKKYCFLKNHKILVRTSESVHLRNPITFSKIEYVL